MQHEDEEGSWKVKEVKKCDGECTINNRKGKLIHFYEWTIKLEYSGTLTGSTTEHKGTIGCDNLSDENDASDLDVRVCCTNDSKNAQTVKDLVRKKAIQMFRDQCAQYMMDLKTEFSKGMILPTKDGMAMNSQKKSDAEVDKDLLKAKEAIKNSCSLDGSSLSAGKANSRVSSVKLTLTEKLSTDPNQLYIALTDEKLIAAYTRADVRVDVRVGGTFSLMNGKITGTFVELEEGKKIVEDWRFSEWPQDTVSRVTLEIKPSEVGCNLHLKQTGVPDNELERTKLGWKNHIFGPMKAFFGFGAKLF
jgi:activator of HSP90 ATPase